MSFAAVAVGAGAAISAGVSVAQGSAASAANKKAQQASRDMYVRGRKDVEGYTGEAVAKLQPYVQQGQLSMATLQRAMARPEQAMLNANLPALRDIGPPPAQPQRPPEPIYEAMAPVPTANPDERARLAREQYARQVAALGPPTIGRSSRPLSLADYRRG